MNDFPVRHAKVRNPWRLRHSKLALCLCIPSERICLQQKPYISFRPVHLSAGGGLQATADTLQRNGAERTSSQVFSSSSTRSSTLQFLLFSSTADNIA